MVALPKKKKKASRSRKQIAAARRNIKKAQAALRRGKGNKRRRSRSGSHMPRKKRRSGGRSRPGKKSFIDRIPILRNPTVQKIGFGLGMGVVIVDLINLASRFAPAQISGPLQQNAGIIKLVVEAATEPISAVVDVALNPGQLSGITSRLSGGGGGNGIGMGNQAGFA